MPRMTLDNLQAGMILSKPVTNANGVVMLPEGAELTEPMIRKMHDMDMECAFVKGAPQEGGSMEEMLAKLDKRFEGVDNAPFMSTIKKIVREHIQALYG